MVGWVAHSNRRRSGAVRLTVETVGIRLSVCLSVSVRQAGSLDSTLPAFAVEGICFVCLRGLRFRPRVRGGSPHICCNEKWTRQGRESIVSWIFEYTKLQRFQKYFLFLPDYNPVISSHPSLSVFCFLFFLQWIDQIKIWIPISKNQVVRRFLHLCRP